MRLRGGAGFRWRLCLVWWDSPVGDGWRCLLANTTSRLGCWVAGHGTAASVIGWVSPVAA
jgi:hypothetical protein